MRRPGPGIGSSFIINSKPFSIQSSDRQRNNNSRSRNRSKPVRSVLLILLLLVLISSFIFAFFGFNTSMVRSWSLLKFTFAAFSSSSSSSSKLSMTSVDSGTTGYEQHQNEDDTIKKVLSTTKTIALVGASKNTARPSNRVMNQLINYGYTVIPINPGLAGQMLYGQTVYAKLEDIPSTDNIQIDMVDIFRNSNDALGVVNDVIHMNNVHNNKNKIKSVWLQIGVTINENAVQNAMEHGNLDVVMNRCPLIEIPRLNINTPSMMTKSSL